MFDWVRQSLNDPAPDDESATESATEGATESATEGATEDVTECSAPDETAAIAPPSAPANKEAKPFIPGAGHIQNQPTTYLEPLPWQLEQLYRAADDQDKSSSPPGQPLTAGANPEVVSLAKVSDLAEKPSGALAHALRDSLTELASDKLSDKLSRTATPGVLSSAPDVAVASAALASAPLAAPPSVVTPSEAHTTRESSAEQAPNSTFRALADMPTQRLAPEPPSDAADAQDTTLAPPTRAHGAPLADAAHAADIASATSAPAPTPPDARELDALPTAPFGESGPQVIAYPHLTMHALSEPNDVAWRLPDEFAQQFDNHDSDSKGANRAPDESALAPGLREYVAPAAAAPMLGSVASAEGAARVDERVRGMVNALLSQRQLRASLPDDVIATLRLLLAPSPTADQIARGMAALGALRTVMEVAQAEALVAALPEALQAWYHAANWSASRLWLARHLDEAPFDAQAQLEDAAAQLRAMGADAGAKTMERHAQLLSVARSLGVDAAYREVIGDDAFDAAAPDDRDVGDIAALKRILDILIAWMETANWSASRDFLLAHPELLDDEAEAILARMYEVEAEQRDPRDRQAIVDHQRLLRDARQLGVDAAYVARARRANAVRASVTPAQAQLAIPLMVWIETPDWHASREYLRTHPALLSDDGELLLTRLAASQTTNHGRQSVADHQRLLSQARERGVDVAYDAFREERRERRRRAAETDADDGALSDATPSASGSAIPGVAAPMATPAPSATPGTPGTPGTPTVTGDQVAAQVASDTSAASTWQPTTGTAGDSAPHDAVWFAQLGWPPTSGLGGTNPTSGPAMNGAAPDAQQGTDAPLDAEIPLRQAEDGVAESH